MKKAFTLIEVMVVMAIIAVLAVLVIGAITITRRTAVETTHRSNASIVNAGLQRAYSLNKQYPATSGYVSFDCACMLPYISAALSEAQECDGIDISGHSADGGGYIQYTNTGYVLHIANYDCTAIIETIVNQ